MIKITFEVRDPKELIAHLQEMLQQFGDPPRRAKITEVETENPPLAEVPVTVEPVAAEPESELEPKTEQPTLEEVRAALKELKERKGTSAVRELLKAYGVDSLPELKPEDYLGALARAKTEV